MDNIVKPFFCGKNVFSVVPISFPQAPEGVVGRHPVSRTLVSVETVIRDQTVFYYHITATARPFRGAGALEHYTQQRVSATRKNELRNTTHPARKIPKKDMIHHQLPLAMPCYDLCLVTELTVDLLQTCEFGVTNLNLFVISKLRELGAGLRVLPAPLH